MEAKEPKDIQEEIHYQLLIQNRKLSAIESHLWFYTVVMIVGIFASVVIAMGGS